MQVSLSSLLEHLETTASLEKICESFLQLGFEVEGVQDAGQALRGFIVGKVITCERHPDADRLSLCHVDIGENTQKQVVCGAPNVHVGMNTAYAPIGARIPASGMTLKATVIRGIASEGMLCSAQELDLGRESDGILCLEGSLLPGENLAKALGLNDVHIDLSITPNRTDCTTPYGLARDLAALGVGVLKKPQDISHHSFHIFFPLHKVQSLGGVSLSRERICTILGNLECLMEEKEDALLVTPPIYRTDLTLAEDLVEEILRVHGYDEIPSLSLPLKSLKVSTSSSLSVIRRLLTGRGLHEIYTYSLVHEKEATHFCEKFLKVKETKSIDFHALRPSLLIGGLKAIHINQRHFQKNLAFFESGYQYNWCEEGHQEIPVLSAVMCQNICEKSWAHPEQSVTLFHGKDLLSNICSALGIAVQVRESSYSFYHPTRQGDFVQGKRIVGHFGEIHPNVQKAFDVKGPVVGLTFYMETKGSLKKGPFVKYPYPPVVRDFCFVLDQAVTAEHVLRAIQKAVKPKDITIFDLFIMPSHQKSLTLQVTFQDPTKTLSEEDVTKAYQSVVDVIKRECGGEIKMKL